MKICLLAKRHYTGRDALHECFGRVIQLPRHWARSGHRVAVYLLDYHGQTPATRFIDDVRVQSIPITRLRLLARAACEIRAASPRWIVASGDCYVGLAALSLCANTGSAFAFDIYDDYRAFAGYRYFCGWKAMEFLQRKAAVTFYASRRLQATFQHDAPSLLIPNGFEPDQLLKGSVAECRRQIGVSDRSTWIGYFGGLQYERGVDVLIQAVAQVRRSGVSGLKLVLAGPRENQLDLSAPFIHDLGDLRHQDIALHLGACNALALPYRRGPFVDQSAPCKLTEYFAAERPVVATRCPALLANFPEEARRLDKRLAKPGDVDSLARSIMAQLKDPIIPPRPTHMTWQYIANSAVQQLATQSSVAD